MVTGLKDTSLQNLILNEGAFLLGFDVSEYTTAATMIDALEDALSGEDDEVILLGATNGGGSFKCVPTTRQIEIDGIRGKVKGVTQVDGWDLSLTGTLKEIRPEVFQRLLMCGEVDTTAVNMTKIKVRSNVKNEDYIDNLVWVGSTPKGYCVIALDSVLNTSGVEMTFEDKNEGTIPFEFAAHNTNLTGDEYLPVTIIFLEDVASVNIIYKPNNSTAEADVVKTAEYGSTYTILNNSDSSLGFTAPATKSFSKWNTKADGTGTDYAAAASYTANADLTLYAVWAS